MFTDEQIKDLEMQSIEKSKDYLQKNELINAESLLRQAKRVFPENKEILSLLGLTYIKKNKFEDSLGVYNDLYKIDPENYETIHNLGYCYNVLGDYEKSEEMLNLGIEKHPNESSLYINLAILYKNVGKYEKAVETYEKAVKMFPTDSSIYFNYGVFLAENQKYQESLVQYRKAIELSPDNYEYVWNKSLIDLLIGNHKEGFEEYESRFKVFKDFQKTKDRFTQPEWDGKPGTGTILFYNEQGLGDIFQFIRFLPHVKEKGFNTIVEVPSSVADVISNCNGVDQIMLWRSKEVLKYDYAVSILSLPRLLGLTTQSMNFQFPYIKPTGSLDDTHFKDYDGMIKVGICWAGSPYHFRDKERSFYLKEFSKLNNLPNVKLFSLQKEISRRYHTGIGVIDLTDGADDMSVVDMSGMLHDFNYTASIIEKMDLIITADTAIAHLAGAMNKNCWVLVPSLPDWRWGSEGEKTLWYSSVRVFRKNLNEKWSDVFDRVEKEIKKL